MQLNSCVSEEVRLGSKVNMTSWVSEEVRPEFRLVKARTFNENTMAATVCAPSIIIGCSEFHPTLNSIKFGVGWALPARLIVSIQAQDSPCIIIG